MNVIISILLLAIVILLIGLYNIGSEILNTIKLLYQIPENTEESDVPTLSEESNPINNKKD